jgi:ubiquinone/menaquinone biosynthesis C-methylase UbiE
VAFQQLAHTIAARPVAYERIQRLAGFRATATRAAEHIGDARTVLDVGGGTGLFRPYVPEGTEYVALDKDSLKLGLLRKRWPDVETLHADAAEIPLPSGSVDCSVCINVAHHLTDEQLSRVVAELARVSRRLVFVDPLRRSDSRVSKLLWRYDRGAQPRSRDELHDALARAFDLSFETSYRVLHTYVLCVGSPR